MVTRVYIIIFKSVLQSARYWHLIAQTTSVQAFLLNELTEVV